MSTHATNVQRSLWGWCQVVGVGLLALCAGASGHGLEVGRPSSLPLGGRRRLPAEIDGWADQALRLPSQQRAAARLRASALPTPQPVAPVLRMVAQWEKVAAAAAQVAVHASVLAELSRFSLARLRAADDVLEAMADVRQQSQLAQDYLARAVVQVAADGKSAALLTGQRRSLQRLTFAATLSARHAAMQLATAAVDPPEVGVAAQLRTSATLAAIEALSRAIEACTLQEA